MSRTRVVHRCAECAATHPRWSGRCPACGAWNSLIEDVEAVGGTGSPRRAPGARRRGPGPQPIRTVGAGAGAPCPTGVEELDRVLGGGLVAGSVTLLGGEPGIGKSTLLLQVAAALVRSGRPVLYVTGEESGQQVRARAERLDALVDDLWLLAETELPAVLAAMEQLSPALVVVDSIQTITDPELGSSAGSMVQVRETAHQLVQAAKQTDVAVMLIGHVTKDGTLAGPRALEHVVDTVLAFEGDRHHALRMLRAVKHRHGPTSELGLFEMEEAGLRPVTDASGLFLADRTRGVPGSAVVAMVEGQRPLLVEVQALVVKSFLPAPRRAVQGIDQGRLAMLLAVLENRTALSFADRDVYVSVVGGVRLGEPGSDLGICLALASALTGAPLGADLLACAEIGLAGELRQVSQTARRLTEGARMGFRRAIVPTSAPGDVEGVDVRRCGSIGEALVLAGVLEPALTIEDHRRRPTDWVDRHFELGRVEPGVAPGRVPLPG
jgi:DNA repair protein RadA/Sms